MLSFAWIILLFPLLGLLITLTFGKRLGKSFIAFVAVAAVVASLRTAGAARRCPVRDRTAVVVDSHRRLPCRFRPAHRSPVGADGAGGHGRGIHYSLVRSNLHAGG